MSEIDRVQIDIGLDQIILLAVGANFYRWGSILLLAFPWQQAVKRCFFSRS